MKWTLKNKSSEANSESTIDISNNLNSARYIAQAENKSLQVEKTPWVGTLRISSPEKPQLQKILKARYLHVQKNIDEGNYDLRLEVPQSNLQTQTVFMNAELFTPDFLKNSRRQTNQEKIIRSPMTGKVLRILVKDGDQVSQGQELVVIEAMKMENKIFAPKAGAIQKLAITLSQSINQGDEMLRIS